MKLRQAILLLSLVACKPQPAPPQRNAVVDGLLAQAATIEVIALDPQEPPSSVPADSLFHGWRVLGRTAVSSKSSVQKLATALLGEVAPKNGHTLCFNPRHAVRVSSGSRKLDLVICYHCFETHAFLGKEPLGSFHPNRTAQLLLNTALDSAGIERAPEPPENVGPA